MRVELVQIVDVKMKRTKKHWEPVLPGIEDILRGVPPVQVAAKQLGQDRIDYDRDPKFVAGYLKAAIVNDIWKAMEKANLSKKAFADRLGKSRQYVGRVLNETANFTIDSMAEIACTLGYRISIRLRR
jgi:hypothetical protein